MTDSKFTRTQLYLSGKIIPVVLAGSSKLDQWPRSRLNMPMQFQRGAQEASPFEKILSELTRFPNTLSPIISLPTAALDTARSQLRPLAQTLNPTAIVEPVDRGSLGAATTAALLAARIDRHALMMIIDPVSENLNWHALRRVAQQAGESTQASDTIIACGEPYSFTSKQAGVITKGERSPEPTLSTIGGTERMGRSSQFKVGGITFATPRSFLEHVEDCAPHLFNCCVRSLNTHDERDGYVWPDINLWSAQPNLSLISVLTQDSPNVWLRPANLTYQKPDRSEQKPQRRQDCFETENTNCALSSQGHLLVVAGCENLDVVSTPDATIITPLGERERAAPLLAQLRTEDRAELSEFPTRFHDWGVEHRIDAGNGFSIHKLVVEPNQPIPLQSHEHRAEQWQVLSGHGEATIGARTYALRPGMSLDIPRGTRHSCTNFGARPMIVLETRHGSILSNLDQKSEPATVAPALA